jgi:4'-phosphopantetheinyl transferase EntD
VFFCPNIIMYAVKQRQALRQLCHAVDMSVLACGDERIVESNPANLSADLSSLLPHGALAAVLRTPGDPASLLPAEAQHLGRAVAARRQEFAAGRLCARRILLEFGILDFALKAAEDRQPIWPETVVGSITHTVALCAAVAAKRTLLRAVGIDCEVVGGVKADLWRSICLPQEILWLHSLPESEQAAAATLIFSAKEAFYKCQYPLVREWLNFHDANIQVLDWGPSRGAFEIHATRHIAFADHATLPLRGQYLFHEHFVTAAIALLAGDLSQ